MPTVQTVWPEGQSYLPPLIVAAYLIIIPTLAILASKRAPASFRSFRELPFVKQIVFIIMVDSVLFTQVSAVIPLGVGSSYNEAACAVGIWLCLSIYTFQKILVYSESESTS